MLRTIIGRISCTTENTTWDEYSREPWPLAFGVLAGLEHPRDDSLRSQRRFIRNTLKPIRISRIRTNDPRYMRSMAGTLIKRVRIRHRFIRSVKSIPKKVISKCYFVTWSKAPAEIGVSVINPSINETDSNAFSKVALCVDLVNTLQSVEVNLFESDTEIGDKHTII